MAGRKQRLCYACASSLRVTSPTNHRSLEKPCLECGHSDDPDAQRAHGRRQLRKRVRRVGLDESAGGLHVCNTFADQCSKEFWIVCSDVTGEARHVGRLLGGARDRHAPNNSHHSIDGSPPPRPSARFPFPSLGLCFACSAPPPLHATSPHAPSAQPAAGRWVPVIRNAVHRRRVAARDWRTRVRCR